MSAEIGSVGFIARAEDAVQLSEEGEITISGVPLPGQRRGARLRDADLPLVAIFVREGFAAGLRAGAELRGGEVEELRRERDEARADVSLAGAVFEREARDRVQICLQTIGRLEGENAELRARLWMERVGEEVAGG